MITIDKGLYTNISIKIKEDLDFTHIKKIVFCIKNNVHDKPIVCFDSITGPGQYYVEITPEQSELIQPFAVYDFNIVDENDKRYKLTENGKINIREGVGKAYD